MLTMTNLHALLPCALCSTRMAIPGNRFCTMCEAITIPTLTTDGIAALECHLRSEAGVNVFQPCGERRGT
jgi:hypothetical protein